MNVVKTKSTPKERGKILIQTNKKGTEQDKRLIVLHINYKKPHYWAHCPQLLALWSLSKDLSVLPTLTESSLISSHHVCAKLSFLAAEFESHFTFKWKETRKQTHASKLLVTCHSGERTYPFDAVAAFTLVSSLWYWSRRAAEGYLAIFLEKINKSLTSCRLWSPNFYTTSSTNPSGVGLRRCTVKLFHL